MTGDLARHLPAATRPTTTRREMIDVTQEKQVHQTTPAAGWCPRCESYCYGDCQA